MNAKTIGTFMAGGAALAGALVALLAAPAQARADEDINAWGKPDFEGGDAAKVAIWRDDDGWHIRFTTAGKQRQYTGFIGTPDGHFTDVTFVRKERGDWARINAAEKRLTFDVSVKGGVDGFDFRSHSTEFRFHVTIDGREVPDRVLIGKNNRNPSKIPFVLTKWESHPRGDGPGKGPGPGPGAGPDHPPGKGGGAGPARGDGPDEDINAWGKPDFERGDAFKVALWRDGDGWHLRWTTAGKKRHFTGWVGTPDGQFTNVDFVRKDRRDWARVNGAEKRLVFDTVTEGGIDGFDFRSNSEHFTFAIWIDGKEERDRVFIGANNRNPSRIPFILTKWESHPRGK